MDRSPIEQAIWIRVYAATFAEQRPRVSGDSRVKQCAWRAKSCADDAVHGLRQLEAE